MSASELPLLSLPESRVLGVLVEKELVTPDVYPMTLNALMAGCNQKTSRDPVLHLADAQVQEALDSLRHRSLVLETYGASGRVMRYAHNMGRALGLSAPVVAMLAILMLRGPQTPGELRINCERLYRFADISAVEAYLEEMGSRGAGALVVKLPRQPGSREHRYAHLLCGAPEMAETMADPAMDASLGEVAALKARVTRLDEEVAELRALVDRLYAELGVAKTPHG